MRLTCLFAVATPAVLIASIAAAQSPPPGAAGPAGGPANLCGELVAFMTSQQEKQPAAAKPPSQGGSASQVTGQSNVAVEAPKSKAPGQEGSGQNAPQASGMSAPISAPSGQAPAKEELASLDSVKELAQRNDVSGCRTVAQRMRRAGVAMPTPLLALAALKQPGDPPSGQSSPSSP
jgi:hypothetical protein